MMPERLIVGIGGIIFFSIGIAVTWYSYKKTRNRERTTLRIYIMRYALICIMLYVLLMIFTLYVVLFQY